MTELLLALVAGMGVFYMYTAYAFRWEGVRLAPSASEPHGAPPQVEQWLAQAGLQDVQPGQFVLSVLALFFLGALVAFSIFGGLVPALVLGGFVAATPVATYRVRRQRRRDRAHDAWPHMIEEIRVMTGSAGRSVPQALFEVGRRAPDELRVAFDAAHREWLLTTDFDRTLEVLKARLADPTADITCEVMLIAHQLGGTDLDRRLSALADDRIVDSQGRKDAVARQAGARFARSFTIVVPIGMALVGMSIGDGRQAYGTSYGQTMVVVALTLMIACWGAATQIMKLPEERRVFAGRSEEAP